MVENDRERTIAIFQSGRPINIVLRIWRCQGMKSEAYPENLLDMLHSSCLGSFKFLGQYWLVVHYGNGIRVFWGNVRTPHSWHLPLGLLGPALTISKLFMLGTKGDPVYNPRKASIQPPPQWSMQSSLKCILSFWIASFITWLSVYYSLVD